MNCWTVYKKKSVFMYQWDSFFILFSSQKVLYFRNLILCTHYWAWKKNTKSLFFTSRLPRLLFATKVIKTYRKSIWFCLHKTLWTRSISFFEREKKLQGKNLHKGITISNSY